MLSWLVNVITTSPWTTLCVMTLLTVTMAVTVLYATLPSPAPLPPLSFTDVRSGGQEAFPSLLSTAPAGVSLSLVVPMYNEEERLGVMLEETMPFLEARVVANPGWTYEVILVDDGSSDSTAKVASDFAASYASSLPASAAAGCDIRVCVLPANRGKGGAVRAGVMVARGEYMLMVDADGATQFSDLARLEDALAALDYPGKDNNGPVLGIAVGSRAHLQDDAVAERSFFRNLLMHAFHALVATLCVSGIRDTQCGFKLFSRDAAKVIFPPLHLERWAFDVELLYLAQAARIPVAEVPVNWEEIPGSKLSVIAASISMAIDLVRIRMAYMLGFWQTV